MIKAVLDFSKGAVMKKGLTFCALLLAVSCSKMSSPTEPFLGTATLIITVRDAATGAGIANAAVEVRRDSAGPIVATGTTNSSGISEITLPAGSCWVRVVPPAGYSFAGGRAELLGSQLFIGSGGTGAVTVSLSKL